jgi:hypothetical protein
LFVKTSLPLRGMKRRLFRGQSLVEVAIAFPVLIMLFTGMVEFGFILNNYLSLLDATRDSARFWSNSDPFDTAKAPREKFYEDAAKMVRYTLDPSYDPETNTFKSSYKGRRIILDPLADDVIISVYGIKDAAITGARPAGPYRLFGHYQPIFTEADVLNMHVTGAPKAGILIVEVHYNYHHVLRLPWMTAWLPNPMHMRAYTIMPIRAAEPK